MVETFFGEIRDALERGAEVKLSGFGNFQLRDKPQRPGVTQRPAKKFLSQRVVSLPSMPSQKLKGMVDDLHSPSPMSVASAA